MLVVDEANFKKEVLESKLPVVVDFYADWCPPCKAFAPVLEKVGKKLEGKVKFVKLNVDNAVEIARTYQVMSIPTTILFKEGKPVGSIMGAYGEADFENWISERI